MRAFRYDINTLRAIAVLAVVLYHFYPEYVPGGFVGVDVFFVISGFLMTQITHQNKTIALKRFYLNRFNRILPALSIMLLVVSILALPLVSVFDLKNLSKHALDSLFFISNITYMKEVNYFDPTALEKWFLHTWSLSVEWQFYILYTLLLTAVYRLKPDINMRNLLVSMAAISFATNIAISSGSPHKAYYLLTTRAWEMVLGGVIFFLSKNQTNNLSKMMLLIGICLVIIPIFTLNNDIVWPGYLAIIPTLGASLVILANSDSRMVNLYPLTTLGKWSYSIYHGIGH